ncbi:MAG TPA: HAD family hydrolase [Dehalococcoidales bacterium]|jgi:haloacid dehalogenase superfamily, subfamily IA, variant 3 with third motif having DD or ED/haloacid dehalogenase superfamily, subfamily IA, variant 1 with third motif having Dx(3-4)D or Dx(3-4)E|nr:HAD family hydrolase [Dehalococcoidales bacterium]
MNKTKAIIFDWGDTVMRDFPEYQGPMAYWPEVEIVAGIGKTLQQLQKDFICCLASNAVDSDAELMGIALSRANLRPYFQHLFTSRELGFKKPDPAFYREILTKLQLKPEDCIAIGNDCEKDIIPAKSVGINTIWFSTHPGSIAAQCADYTITSMDELVPVIETLITGYNAK